MQQCCRDCLRHVFEVPGVLLLYLNVYDPNYEYSLLRRMRKAKEGFDVRRKRHFWPLFGVSII